MSDPVPANPESSNPRSEGDALLVRRCLGGEERAWRELVRRYSPLVYSIGMKAGLGPDQRDDLVQTTFLALFRRLSSLRDGQSLAKWIITTATRETWRASRLMKAQVARAEPLSLDPDRVAGWERSHAVDLALNDLGGKCEELLRTLFSSRNEPDYQQISQTLGMPVGSIGPTRQRCLAKLADLLREHNFRN